MMNTTNKMAKVYDKKGEEVIKTGKYIMVLPLKPFDSLTIEGAGAAYFRLIRVGWLKHQRRIRIMKIDRFNSFIPKASLVKGFAYGTSARYKFR